ncbi:ABC transporter ATP-binding protein [Helcococcus kunzii]|uniref:ABC transporter ATP-binding protein n=1 Tax=Helcococcus kunzii TaxID=40091 RepID=UPI001C95B8A0|nr:ATP-binding cassette domain-containing protein [Helcococcus kunzii]MCT1796101.1 ATP-binding cassette domain-containing protein [Helcococcus kunzii]MCT1989467.1 ATP-binding cassette domain-containing protein [Helcococcus kunzii]QZO76826.1 ATP-binding cassette domain-containing protein [Helcococcus kunzii]
MIVLNNINLSFGNKEVKQKVLKDLSVKFVKDDLVTIMGKSGSGKSSLLKILAGFLLEDSGEIMIDSKDLKELSVEDRVNYLSRFISFVWQDFKLIDEINIKNNILLPLNIHKLKFDEEYFEYLINELEISNLMKKFPNQLSGGEKQRCAIARALITKPKVLLADEPTGALDEKTGNKLVDIIKNVLSNFADLVIIVTHDKNIAAIGNKKYNLIDGRLEQYE